MSPGTMRMRKKMNTATPNSVGIIRRKRFTTYFHIAVVTPRCYVCCVAAPVCLLRKPDRVQLLVEIVARRDGPAVHLRAVRDDAVPLERVDVVNLFVQEPLLEGAKVLLALLGIDGPRLLDVEVVEHLVLVAAVVRVGDRSGLELVDVEVGLHGEAALEVGRDLEVSAAKHAVVGGGLDDLLPDVDADLPPLVDGPYGQRLVRHGHAAVLVYEGEVLGARLLQQTLGLCPVGRGVLAVAS